MHRDLLEEKRARKVKKEPKLGNIHCGNKKKGKTSKFAWHEAWNKSTNNSLLESCHMIKARRPSPRTIPPGNLAIGLWNPSNNKRWQVIQGSLLEQGGSHLGRLLIGIITLGASSATVNENGASDRARERVRVTRRAVPDLVKEAQQEIGLLF
ncbi:hypothetical protein M405DRAFT_889664 [Rhizopogon salebrosus TDB-379]|nr:hypothetical protein M405DRAFT_889664 [Rhizopogon salebrosus TDB-379]